MKSNLLLISLLVASPAFAASFAGKEPSKGTTSTDVGKKPTTPVNAPVTTKPVETKLPPLALGPQVTGMFRILKADGSTVIAQTAITVGTTSSVNVINVATADALRSGNGRCAFNAQYDEVSGVAATNTTNRIFSNDALVAQNTKVDLVANVLKSSLTQPYLMAGQNNVRVVINADSASPSVGWVRVNVSGSCAATSPDKEGSKDGAAKEGAKEPHGDLPKTVVPPSGGASAPVTTPPKTSFKEVQKEPAAKEGAKEPHGDLPKTVVPPSGGASAPVTMPSKEPTKTAAPVGNKFGPDSAQWKNLATAFSYSTSGVALLKGNKDFTRYADLAKLNADIGVFISAKVIDEANFNALMTRWNSFATDAAFRKAMTAAMPRR